VDADVKREILRITILELLAKGCVHYTELEKKVNASGHSFATTNTFKSQLHYLLKNKYVNRVSRGIYQITSKGQKYLDLLTF
jgi:DNA-binding PadR family transcriptional regulator